MSSPKRVKLMKEETTDDMDVLKSLLEIDQFQEEVRNLQDKSHNEILKLEFRLEKAKRPIYVKREEPISEIPNFWVTALVNHPDISSLLEDTEEDYLLYLWKIDVQLSEESVSSFKIFFHFKENPYFKNTLIVKEYNEIKADEKVSCQKLSTAILWKEGQDISTKLKERKSFLFWLTTNEFGITDIDIAQVIKDDLWVNPLHYYLLSDNDNEENSDDEDENDDVLLLEHSDDEKSNQEEPDEEESDNETEECDSPGSSELTQNDN